MKSFDDFLNSSSKEFEESIKQIVSNSIGDGGKFDLEELLSLIVSMSDALTVERLRLYHEWLHS